MKIRKRDGTITDAASNYVLQDGEVFLVPIEMQDSQRMITDAHGHPAGQRPGFLYDSGDVALAVRETLHREYCDAISQRWMSDRWQGQKLGNAQHLPGRIGVIDSNLPGHNAVNDRVSSVDASYAQYRHDIENRWRK